MPNITIHFPFTSNGNFDHVYEACFGPWERLEWGQLNSDSVYILSNGMGEAGLINIGTPGRPEYGVIQVFKTLGKLNNFLHKNQYIFTGSARPGVIYKQLEEQLKKEKKKAEEVISQFGHAGYYTEIVTWGEIHYEFSLGGGNMTSELIGMGTFTRGHAIVLRTTGIAAAEIRILTELLFRRFNVHLHTRATQQEDLKPLEINSDLVRNIKTD